jgi:phosphohistidine phosphatase
MDLYLVRHAIAEPRDGSRWRDDSLRPLTPDGKALFRAGARGLRRLGVEVEAVLASPYTRAWDTAVILAKQAGWPSPEASPALEPANPPSSCVEALEMRSESSLALVGHQPQLSRLASLLACGNEDALRLELKKGGVLCLRIADAPAASSGVLRWSASPRMLRILGGRSGRD